MPQNSQIVPNNAISVVGTYQYVNDYNDVANAPVPVDGTAKLFINFNQKIMWAKKFVDGKHNIQAYMFDVYNGENELPVNVVEKNQPAQDIHSEPTLKDVLDRLEKLENKNKLKKKNESEVTTNDEL